MGVLGLVGWYTVESREMGALQQAATAHTQNSLALGQLVEEAVQYSRRDPSIVPVLNHLAGRPEASTPQPSAPSLNPARR